MVGTILLRLKLNYQSEVLMITRAVWTGENVSLTLATLTFPTRLLIIKILAVLAGDETTLGLVAQLVRALC